MTKKENQPAAVACRINEKTKIVTFSIFPSGNCNHRLNVDLKLPSLMRVEKKSARCRNYFIEKADVYFMVGGKVTKELKGMNEFFDNLTESVNGLGNKKWINMNSPELAAYSPSIIKLFEHVGKFLEDKEKSK